MTTQKKLVTAAEFLNGPWPEWSELVDGEVVEMTPPGKSHGRTVSNAVGCMWSFVRERRLGVVLTGTGVRVRRDPDAVRVPDAAFISADRAATTDQPGYLEIAPDLVVEVISPSDGAADVDRKLQEYLRAGVRLVLLLYTDTQTVHMHRPDGSARVLSANDTLDGEDVLPGFSVPVSALFE